MSACALLSPALLAEPGAEAVAEPAVQPSVEAPAERDITVDSGGTTIVGERDTAVGLFVAPWKNQNAADLDLAPGPYDVPLEPVDVQRFRRLADYDQANRDYMREQQFRVP